MLFLPTAEPGLLALPPEESTEARRQVSPAPRAAGGVRCAKLSPAEGAWDCGAGAHTAPQQISAAESPYSWTEARGLGKVARHLSQCDRGLRKASFVREVSISPAAPPRAECGVTCRYLVTGFLSLQVGKHKHIEDIKPSVRAVGRAFCLFSRRSVPSWVWPGSQEWLT